MLRVFAVCLVFLPLASCADQVGPYRVSNPPDARSSLVTQAVKRIFAETKMPGTPHVSRIYRAHVVSRGDWLMCLRSSESAHPLRYALFFTGHTYAGAQTAAIVDRCDEQEYLPLLADVPTGQPLIGAPILLHRTSQ